LLVWVREENSGEPFTVETMLMPILRSKRMIVLLVAALAVITILAAYLRRQLAIDGCLDHGGRWNYVANRCED
jgi:hypothetical protein